jgi:hypothetical protein
MSALNHPRLIMDAGIPSRCLVSTTKGQATLGTTAYSTQTSQVKLVPGCSELVRVPKSGCGVHPLPLMDFCPPYTQYEQS